MQRLHIFFLLFSSFHYAFLVAEPNPEATTAAAADFIRTECQVTRYPALCVQCLSSYATSIQHSQRQLAQAALSVSIYRAKSAASFVSKLAKARGRMTPKERGAVRDCVENVADTVDQLIRSVKELDGMDSRGDLQDFRWHVSNVQTWVSAALTDVTTCLDGFGSGGWADGKVKGAIRKRMIGCAQVTSNALALVNRFADRQSHKAEITRMP